MRKLNSADDISELILRCEIFLNRPIESSQEDPVETLYDVMEKIDTAMSIEWHTAKTLEEDKHL